MSTSKEWVERAHRLGLAIPGFNIPYLPMMEPVVRALRDTDVLGFIMVAKLEWEKFKAGSPKAVRDEYFRLGDRTHTRLHLDHVPVIDEDHRRCDYAAIIGEALDLGYDSAMVDGSRLPFDENLRCTAEAARLAAARGCAIEAELGAVAGHESGPLPPYDELFARRHGFTDPGEARRFAEAAGVDWLSVAAGNLHGAISAAARGQAKPTARLDLDLLAELSAAARVPLVLHGGTGIPAGIVRRALAAGVAKVNIATAIRQPYEKAMAEGHPTAAGQEAVYRETRRILEGELELGGSRRLLFPQEA